MGGGKGDTPSETSQTVTQTGTTTVNQKAEPWSGVQAYLSDLYARTNTQSYRSVRYYPSNTHVPLNQFHYTYAKGQINDYARTSLPARITEATAAWQEALDAPDVINNNYVTGMANTITDKVEESWTNNLHPSIAMESVQVGQYGSSRHGVAQALGLAETTEGIANALAELYSNAYNTGVNARDAAVREYPNFAQAHFVGADMLIKYGNLKQADEQASKDYLIAKWDHEQNEPWQRFSNANAIYSGASPFRSETKSSTGGPSTSTQTITGAGGSSSALAAGVGAGVSLLGLFA